MNGRPPISDAAADEPSFKQLASYRHCLARMQAAWPEFASRRRERLQQGPAQTQIIGTQSVQLVREVLDTANGQLLCAANYSAEEFTPASAPRALSPQWTPS